MNSTEKPIVAAFDFDGTLTYRDTLLPYLFFVKGSVKTITGLIALTPIFLKYLIGKASRQDVKERIITHFFIKDSYKYLKSRGADYAHEWLPGLCRPEAIERLRWHLKQGHRCILVSASLDIYLEPWSIKSGISDILTSRLETTADGGITGKLSGLNCRGLEKVRRLETLLGPRDAYTLYAYGDSPGDKELLEYADFPFYKTFPKS